MSNVKLQVTNKGVVIALVILFLIFAGAGSYLLWRVNQDDTVAPTDSEAGSNQCNCCPSSCSGTLPPCYASQNCTGRTPPAYPVACQCVYASSSCPTIPVCASECDEGGDCDACTWPNVAFCVSGTCQCKRYDTPSLDPCEDTSPQCTLSCGAGYENPYFIDAGQSCQPGEQAVDCSAECDGCGNPYIAKGCCKPKPPANVCDSGSVFTSKPTGTYNYCAPISYSATAKDTNGIDPLSISVKLNTVARTGFAKVETATQTIISETLSTATTCLPAGTYTLDLSWKDKLGAGGTQCSLTTSFTVLEEVKNPNWEISKTPVELCIDENTEDPKAQLSYTITIRNTGEGAGKITSIVDVLDTKVQDSYMGSISNGGVYSHGKITWTLTGTDQDFAAGQSKTYSYSYTVPKDAFGEYANTVTATPSTGSSIIANADIIADCVISETPPDIPQTGIFDDSKTITVLGAVLLFLGLAWTWVTDSFRRLLSSYNQMGVRKTRENFERKVVKR